MHERYQNPDLIPEESIRKAQDAIAVLAIAALLAAGLAAREVVKGDALSIKIEAKNTSASVESVLEEED
ncbi:MAG: hypothetical protein ABII07_02725 [Patescibacteria group bacterium]|nr:hypothetical protein [Patescibacteria group bacterium]